MKKTPTTAFFIAVALTFLPCAAKAQYMPGHPEMIVLEGIVQMNTSRAIICEDAIRRKEKLIEECREYQRNKNNSNKAVKAEPRSIVKLTPDRYGGERDTSGDRYNMLPEAHNDIDGFVVNLVFTPVKGGKLTKKTLHIIDAYDKGVSRGTVVEWDGEIPVGRYVLTGETTYKGRVHKVEFSFEEATDEQFSNTEYKQAFELNVRDIEDWRDAIRINLYYRILPVGQTTTSRTTRSSNDDTPEQPETTASADLPMNADDESPRAVGTAAAGDSSFAVTNTRVLPAQFARENADTPQQVKSIEADVINQLKAGEDKMRYDGLPLHDVAAADAFFIAALYSAYNNGETLNKAQQQKIYQSFAAGYANSSEFQAYSDEKKQLVYESKLFFGETVMKKYEEAKAQNTQAKIKEARETAQKVFKEIYGYSLEKASKEFRKL